VDTDDGVLRVPGVADRNGDYTLDAQMKSLHLLAKKYSCDKLYSHSYIPFYEFLFANREVKRLLEMKRSGTRV